MTNPVAYSRTDLVSTITMDDGKVNVFSIPMLQELHRAFDRAEQDGTVVVLQGRPGCFSAGFDLKTLGGPPQGALALLRSGASLAGRVLAFPAPVVVACTGHAFPAGAFLLMAADVRLGADGAFRLGLNEVRIGLTLPWFAIVLARHRLTHATVTGEMFDPQTAREAGLLDAVVPAAELSDRAQSAARDLSSIDRSAHAATKRRVRKIVLGELQRAVEGELADPASAAQEGTGHPTPSDP
ncbi:MAG: crotonase/enoyl-CoA hydratase family protein [Acidimicrobiales bacterium]